MVSTIRTQGYPDELTALCATHSVAIQCNSSDYFDSSSNDANNLYSLLNKVSFYLFSVFSNTNFTELTAGVSRIRTWIVRVQGKHADHLTTTTAHVFTIYLPLSNIIFGKYLMKPQQRHFVLTGFAKYPPSIAALSCHTHLHSHSLLPPPPSHFEPNIAIYCSQIEPLLSISLSEKISSIQNLFRMPISLMFIFAINKH